MCNRTILLTATIVLLLTRSCTSRGRLSVRPCYTNKLASEGRTLGLLLGQWGGQNGCEPGSPLADPPSTLEPSTPPGDDYVDPVHSEEDISVSQDNNNNNPSGSSSNSGGFGGLFDWLPSGLITQDHWPVRPDKPPVSRPPFGFQDFPFRPPQLPIRPPVGNSLPWFLNWFDQSPFKPQRPMKPWGNKPGNDIVKPVHEDVEEDAEQITWRPGAVVGGPNNNIGPVTQDLSSWNRPPTPRPTRPQIPGYPNVNRLPGIRYNRPDVIPVIGNARQPTRRPTADSDRRHGIFGSFVDLLFK